MDVSFVVRKVLAGLVLPPTGPLILALVGLVLDPWFRRTGRCLVWAGVLLLLALSLPFAAQALTWLIFHDGALDETSLRQASAIVIVGGGVRTSAVEYGGDTLGRLTLERVRYGAYLARKTGLPVLVSGGALQSESTEADLMARALEEEYGIATTWRERISRNTLENAQASSRILRVVGIERIILVTHSFDVPRAKREFEEAGLHVISAPTHITRVLPLAASDLLPSAAALQTSYYACYELLANLARWLGLRPPSLS